MPRLGLIDQIEVTAEETVGEPEDGFSVSESHMRVTSGDLQAGESQLSFSVLSTCLSSLL